MDHAALVGAIVLGAVFVLDVLTGLVALRRTRPSIASRAPGHSWYRTAGYGLMGLGFLLRASHDSRAPGLTAMALVLIVVGGAMAVVAMGRMWAWRGKGRGPS